jgi:CDP-paratose 2-epimerase
LQAFEAARANLTLTAGEIYNVGGGAGNAISLVELIRLIERKTGESMQIRYDAPRPGDQLVYVTDHGKLTRETGWRPASSVAELLDRIENFWLNEIKPAEVARVCVPISLPAEILQKEEAALPRSA